MIEPPDFHLIMMVPAIVLAAAALVALVWLGVHAVRYLVAGEQARPVLRVAWRIKYTWRRTARRVGLVQVERRRPPIWSFTPYPTVITRELLPAITVHPERWGVRVDASTVGRLDYVKRFWTSAIRGQVVGLRGRRLMFRTPRHGPECRSQLDSMQLVSSGPRRPVFERCKPDDSRSPCDGE